MNLRENRFFRGVEFRSMTQFCHLCQTHQLALTAEQLQFARSGVSETISSLEQQFKLKLFKRSHKKFLPNETALVLNNGFHLLGLLEEFACRNVHTPHDQLSWVKIGFPVHFYCGYLSQALFGAIRDCAAEFPQTLFWPCFTNSYFEGGQPEEGWEPDWPRVFQSDIVLDSLEVSGAAGNPLKTGRWLMLHTHDVPWGTEPALQDIRQHKLTLPRMPWPLLQQAVDICTKNDISFDYDENDYFQLLSDAAPNNKIILLNELSLDPLFAAQWKCTPFADETMALMRIVHHEDYAVSRYFERCFRQRLVGLQQESIGLRHSTSMKQWHYFGMVIKTGSIRKAAHELFLAQPAVSTQIRHFEQNLEVVAINRKKGSRSLEITPAGMFLVGIEEGMKGVIASLENYIASQQLQQYRHLYLGVLPSVDVHSKLSELIVNQVAKWQQHYPDVRLEIIEDKQSALTALLRSQHIHLAFIETKVPWLIQDSVSMPEEMGVVISPVLLQVTDNGRKKKLSWSDIKHYPLVLPRRGSGLRTLIDQHCFEQGVVLQPEVESDSFNINQRWIVEGKYASILPQSAADSLIQAGLAVFLPLHPSLKRILRLSYLKNRPLNNMEKSLIDFLRLRIEEYAKHKKV